MDMNGSVMTEEVANNVEPRQLRRKSMTARKLYETSQFIANKSEEVDVNNSSDSSSDSSSSDSESGITD